MPLTATRETPVTAPDTASRLSAWITSSRISSRYDAGRLAAFMIAQFGEAHLTRWLDAGGTPYLRGACERYVDAADMTPERQAAEDYYHGHGEKPRRARRGKW